MAHGACDNCGCAFEEHECEERAPHRSRRPSPRTKMTPGDWVRVKTGELRGAAGCVKHVDHSSTPALVRFRQLNGNEVRLPLGLLEFVSYAGSEPDVL